MSYSPSRPPVRFPVLLVAAVFVALGLALVLAGLALAQPGPRIEILADSASAPADTADRGVRIRVSTADSPEHDIEISIGGNTRSSGIVRFGEDIVINEGEFVDGDVVAMGGSVKNFGRINGDCVAMGGSIEIGDGATVDGDAVCMAGRMTIGENARVNGDAVSIWGRMERAQTAEVGGDVVQVGGVGPVFGVRLPGMIGGGGGDLMHDTWSLLRRAVWVAILIGLAVLLFMLFPSRMERLSGTVSESGVKAFFAGLAGWVLWLPVNLALFITIIGIPVMIILILLTPLFILFGYVAVGDALGRRFGGRFGSAARPGRSAVVIGILCLEGPVLLGRLLGLAGSVFDIFGAILAVFGFAVMFLAATTGFGALIISRFRPAAVPTALSGPAASSPIFTTPGPAGGATAGGTTPA